MAAASKNVALIEQQHLGGSCVNFGCTPTKAALASAKLARDARRAKSSTKRRSYLDQSFQNQPHLSLMGGHARFEGLDPSDVLTAENWLELSELPSKIAFFGSGYVGLEMGQFYRRMGSEVILLEAGKRILSHEDDDVSDAIQNYLRNEGIQFSFCTECLPCVGPARWRGIAEIQGAGNIIESN